MTEVILEKPENKHVRADRIAREYIAAERNAREKKTARLRKMRRKAEGLALNLAQNPKLAAPRSKRATLS